MFPNKNHGESFYKDKTLTSKMILITFMLPESFCFYLSSGLEGSSTFSTSKRSANAFGRVIIL